MVSQPVSLHAKRYRASTGLYSAFVVSPKVTAELVEDFIEAQKGDLWPGPEYRGDEDEGHVFVVLRTLADLETELQRALDETDQNEDLAVIQGTRLPIRPTDKCDFQDYSIGDLCQLVIDKFDAFSPWLNKWTDRDSVEWAERPCSMPINCDWFAVLDERTVEDGTVLIVNIPSQHQYDGQNTRREFRTRRWVQREAYNDYELWDDIKYEEEIMTARVRMGHARIMELAVDPGCTDIRHEFVHARDEGISQEWVYQR